MNNYLKWYGRFIWIGVLINMAFAVPALIAPNMLNTMLGLPMQAFYPWLNNTGMLLIGVSLFYLPAGCNPEKWFTYSWLTALSRLIAVVFWIWLVRTSPYPEIFITMMFSDGFMFLVLTVLLQLGLPNEGKISLANFKKVLGACWDGIRARFASRSFQAGFVIAILVLGLIGYQAWYNLLRVVPQPEFASDEDHYKYAAIGLGMESRIPLYLFEVLPEMFPEKMPGKDGWASFGLIFEGGRDQPIGLAKRQIGYPSIEPTCSLCHTGVYQKSPEDVPVPILTGPAITLDLEAFQWFLYDVAQDPKFTPANVMKEIKKKHDLGFFEGLFYRMAILPIAKISLSEQAKNIFLAEAASATGCRPNRYLQPHQDHGFRFPR